MANRCDFIKNCSWCDRSVRPNGLPDGRRLLCRDSSVHNVLAEFRFKRVYFLVLFEPRPGLLGGHCDNSTAAPVGVPFLDGIFGLSAAFTTQEIFPLGCSVQDFPDMKEIVIAPLVPVRGEFGCCLRVVPFAVNNGFCVH